MSQRLLAVVVLVLLLPASLRSVAQMVAVPATADATQSLPGDGSAKLYSTADHSAADGPVEEALPAAALPDPATTALPDPAATAGPDPAVTAPALLEPVIADPALPSAAAPILASPTPAAPGPVTLPPKPAKVRDLPALGGGDQVRVRPFRAVAFGLTASSLGAGGELAIPVARTLNVRVGASYLKWQYPFELDGIDYDPGLKFTSGRATIDWFPHHGAFHVSVGALYFRNAIGGSANVTEGQSFSLGGTSYVNSVDDPIHGTATITYGKQIAPMVLLGFGNILPRSGRHFSVPFEFGGAYMEPPTLNLKLKGTACTMQGCFNAATDPEVQANVTQEVNTLQQDIRLLQVYPIVSLGLACRF